MMNSECENAFLKEKFPELLETREITGEIVQVLFRTFISSVLPFSEALAWTVQAEQ